MAPRSSSSLLLPTAVLLVGIGAYRVQRPRLIAAVVTARTAHDSMTAHIAMLRSLSHQDTAVLRRQVMSNTQEIATAERMIPEIVNTPELMLSVDTLTRRYHLTSGPLMPDSVSIDPMEPNAYPYGIEAFQITVTGTWEDIVVFVEAVPQHAGPVLAIPTVRGLIRARANDRSLTADIAIMIVTRHSRRGLPSSVMGQPSGSVGKSTPTSSMETPTLTPLGL